MDINELKNLDFKKVQNKFLPYINKFQKYSVLVFIIFLFFIYSFLILKINSLSKKEPDESLVTEKLLTVKQLKVNQSAIDSIQKLQDNSNDVRALFKNARENPFYE